MVLCIEETDCFQNYNDKPNLIKLTLTYPISSIGIQICGATKALEKKQFIAMEYNWIKKKIGE